MRHVLILLPLLGLAACATPQQICVSEASQDLAVVNSLIAQTSLNLQRGYGITERQEVRTIPRMCSERDSDGNVVDWDFCDTTYVRDIREPVALDLRAEQDKLHQLEQQRDRLTAATTAAVQQCLATYPE